MADGIMFRRYTIADGVFKGTLEVTDGLVIQNIILKDKRGERKISDVIYNMSDDKNVYNIEIDMANTAIGVGTWYPVVIDADNNEYNPTFKYMDYEYGLINLSRETYEIDPENKVHYMCALDKNSRFNIRKWKNKAELIRKNNIKIDDYQVDGYEVLLKIKPNKLKPVCQTEVWLWSRALKKVFRIALDADAVNSGEIKFDIQQFFDEYEDEFDRLWEVFLVSNRTGACFLSRIEFDKHEDVMVSHDESQRFLISNPKYNNDGDFDWVFQMYFDQFSLLSVKFVERKVMYRGMFRGRIKDFNLKGSTLIVHVLCNRDEFEERRLILRYKNEDYETENVEEYEFKKIKSQPMNEGILLTFVLDYKDVKWTPLRYELILFGLKDDYWYEFRLVGNDDKFYKRLSHTYRYSYLTEEDILVYITESIGGKLVIECRKRSKYDSAIYNFKEVVALNIFKLLKKLYCFKKNLLFYEKFCTAAQDNSYYMFEYFMKRKNKKIRPLYVIKKEQPIYKKLKKKYGRNVLQFMSIRHLIYLQAADAFVSTDSKRHCYKWRAGNTKIMQMLNNKKFVFLQHGVLGFKRVENIYGKQYLNRADLFVASSERERDIITKWFGYDAEEIIITGLARWDKLKSEPENPPMIFYMPTWRKWIVEEQEEEFVKTDYFKVYQEVLNSPKLLSLLEKKNVNMAFCFHPKFRQFLHLLECNNSRIKLISFDDCQINKMLMKCSMFITDYSSASWDAYYMGKPVLFYQFDYEKYIERQGSYINLERELFGYRSTNFDDFINDIEVCIESGFADKSKSLKVRDEYLPLRGKDHRKRIYKAVLKLLK